MPRSKSPNDVPLKVIGIKTSPEWAQWLAQFARSQKVSVAALVDRALVEHAKSLDFQLVPPQRIP
jgi:hypothetical protein